jgi:signal transduction histidine kinase
LTVIRTAAFNLRGKIATNPAQVERYGALIQNESEKLTGLVEQVLQFSRAESGSVIREREPVSVGAVIEDGVESSKSVLEQNGATVETHIEPGLPVVLADSVALGRAVQNLVCNAAKYGTNGSRWIGVFAKAVNEHDQASVEIRVADRGPGIPADELRRIFEPFFRGQRAVQDQIHGTGLGLSLVKGIVEAHEGSITVTSEPAKGTEFVMRIPAAPPEQQDEFTHSTG